MIKLKDMVTIKENNEYCVILEIEDGHDMDLFCLGCFRGDEKMIRVARDDSDTITIVYDDNHKFSWGSGTLVSDKISEKRRLILECLGDLGLMRKIFIDYHKGKPFYIYAW